ncbi:hypothetical protein [Halobacteriovorax marinus]|uniref:hypothetical protein n=1 Tax=Halobacteriovorax marinus TaxID=97084 RepID=UPI003A8F6238
MMNFIVTFVMLAHAQTPLFNNAELKKLEYLKSSEFLMKQRKKDLQEYSHTQIRSILKLIGAREQKILDQKVNAEFWESFDQVTDDQIRVKIMLDLILKDLYEKEGE